MISRLVRGLAFRRHDQDGAEPAQLDLNDHVIVLGWGPQTPTVVAELLTASEARQHSTIVVMGEESDTVMQAAIESRLLSKVRNEMVCCTGRVTQIEDLARLSPQLSRAIVVLPAGDDGDSVVLQTLAALARHWASTGRIHPYRVVTALHDPNNSDFVGSVAGTQVQLIMIDLMVTRMVAHSCLQPGLSLVFEDLLTNEGHEIYRTSEPRLAGLTFGDALYGYERSTPIGLRFASGTIQICPPLDTRIGEGDELIAISADANTVAASIGRDVVIDGARIQPMSRSGRGPQRILLVGWNRRAPLLLQHLDAVVVAGSTLHVVHGSIGHAGATRHALQSLTHLANSFDLLSEADAQFIGRLASAGYDRIIVLSQPDPDEALEAAATTLAVAQQLRDSAWRSDRPFAIVAESGEHTGLHARQWTSVDELVAIDRLVALMVAQIAAAGERAAVFQELLDAGGAEFAWGDAEAYVSLDAALSFYTVVESARRRGEVAIGYRTRRARTLEPRKRVVLNPDKRDHVTYAEGDQILVLRNPDGVAGRKESA